MNTYNIKGACENCGYFHKGTVNDDYVAQHKGGVSCPNCKKLTSNWDEAMSVDAQDKEEKVSPDYKESVYA